jgi:glutaredoxin
MIMQSSAEEILEKANYPGRPEISVYWSPGCSMCLNTKEFLEKRAVPYESVNCVESPTAREELAAVGLRGLPVVRKGKRFCYVQSLDVVAEFLDLPRGNRRLLSKEELIERWVTILEAARGIVTSFTPDELARRATKAKPRTVLVLSSHVYQIPEIFIRIFEEGLVEFEELQNKSRADIVTRDDLLAFIERTMTTFHDWRARRGAASIPETVMTYYGEQPSYRVLERAVWHSAQHVRQLDTVAAGLGGEFLVSRDLYQDLPMPERLWA